MTKQTKQINQTTEENKEEEQIQPQTTSSLEASLQAARTIEDVNLEPVYLKNKDTGSPEPYYIINNKYVPCDEAQIIFQEQKIAKEQKKLEELKLKIKK